MIKSLSSAASACTALCILCVVTNGQEVGSKPFKPVAGPLGRIVYDISSREIIRLSDPRDEAFPKDGLAGGRETGAARVVANCFLNTSTMGYFGTGTVDTEWRDWAGKATGKNGVIRRFYFGYATSAEDPDDGGPGAAIEIAFYAGETGFCTASGSEIPRSRFCFTGLPGVLSTFSPVGYLITAIAPNKTFCVPDGKIGWSYGFKDNDGHGEALTGPLLTSFVSANSCARDAYDRYSARPSSEGTCAGSFFFGGCEPLPQPPFGIPCASFYIGLGEDDGADVPAAVFHEPAGCNAATFLSTDAPPGPAIGKSWNSRVSPVTHQICHLRITSGVCGGGLKPGFLNGTAIYAVSPVVFDATQNNCPDPHTWSLPVQKNLALVGDLFCAQSFGVDVAPITTVGENAEDLTVGTPQ